MMARYKKEYGKLPTLAEDVVEVESDKEKEDGEEDSEDGEDDDMGSDSD